MTVNEKAFQRTDSATNWPHIISIGGVYLLSAVAMLAGFMWRDDIAVRRQEIEVTHRLIQRMDTDSLITERALAALEGRSPSEKASRYQLRTEKAD